MDLITSIYIHIRILCKCILWQKKTSLKCFHCVKVTQLCLTLCNPMDCGPPRLLCPWNSPGQSTGVGCRPSPEDLPKPGMEPRSPTLQSDSLPSEPPGKPGVFLFITTCLKERIILSVPHFNSRGKNAY